MHEQGLHLSFDKVLLDLDRVNTKIGLISLMRAFAMLCDTSYTTCMSKSSGVLLNIFAKACRNV